MKKQDEKITNQLRGNGFDKYIDEAEKILNNEQKFEQLLQRLEVKMRKIPKCGNLLANVPVLASLLNHYFHKTYTKAPIGTILAVLTAIIYLVAPIDVVSDLIVGVGYLDDAGVMAACMALIMDDIDEYKEWRENKDQ